MKRKYLKRGYKSRCSMKSDLNRLSVQAWGLYSGNYSLARGQHKLRRSSQCSLSLAEQESKNILAATHTWQSRVQVLLPLSALTHVRFMTQKPAKHQEIQIQPSHDHSTTCSPPQDAFLFTLRGSKLLFSWLCVVVTTPKTGREAWQGDCATAR